MTMHRKLCLLSAALAVSAALPGAALAQDRHGVVIAPPAAPPVAAYELGQMRPRGLFYTRDDFTVDYNSYSYDDRYHGPPPIYGRPPAQTYFYAPGFPAYRHSAGGTLYYWPRSEPR
jgi:hypothetical protein